MVEFIIRNCAEIGKENAPQNCKRALRYTNQDALNSDDYIIKILAILDKRVDKGTLQKIAQAGEYKQYPAWARQFYELRLSLSQ